MSKKTVIILIIIAAIVAAAAATAYYFATRKTDPYQNAIEQGASIDLNSAAKSNTSK